MADITPYEAGDATLEDLERHAKQQRAEAMEAVRVSTPERTVERPNLKDIQYILEDIRKEKRSRNRFHVVYSKHSRSV